MNGLDIFAGSGIGSLAMKHIIPNYRTVGYVEFEEYPCKVIEARIRDGILCDAPIWQIDIREFNRRIAPIYKGMVDIVYGGFPCQPFSIAGKNKGADDERNMWPATLECLSIIQPRYALLENVPNILTHEYIRRIFGDLAEIGYDCEWDIVGASDVGAPHRRKRVWILAHTEQFGRRGGNNGNEGRCEGSLQTTRPCSADEPKILAYPRRLRCDTGWPEQSLSRIGSHGENEDVADNISSRQLQPQGSIGDIGRRAGDTSQEMADTETSNWWWTDPADDFRRWYSEIGGCSKQINKSEYREIESSMGRVVDGLANRVDRLKMLGNGWVPAVVARILQVIDCEANR